MELNGANKQTKNCKLDPSLLLINQAIAVNLNETNLEHQQGTTESNKMSIRRRNVILNINEPQQYKNEDNSIANEQKAICLPQRPKYLMEQVKVGQCTKQEQQQQCQPTDLNDTKTTDHRQISRSQIFFIANSATTILLISMMVTLVGFVCLFSLNTKGSVLFVNAQYPNGGSVGGTPSQSGAQSSRSAQAVAPQRHQSTDRLSIDRFDSGEQIRAPLLRPPTTLPPLHRQQRQQFSLANQHAMQAAASQDSYLSPEEREQLMKSQESHYEGRTSGVDQQVQQPNSDASGPDRDSGGSGVGMANSNNNSPTLQTEASGSSENDEDPDYEDGDRGATGPDEQQKRANLVPETRRMAVGLAPNNHLTRQQHQQAARQLVADMTNASEEPSDPGNDDYSSAGNDDTYFSRKSTGNPRAHAGLSLAASYNQNNRNQAPAEGQHLANMLYESPSRFNRGDHEDSQGFGPGPNEAYMADRADSAMGDGGVGGADSGDEEPSGADSDTDSAPSVPFGDDPSADPRLIERRVSARNENVPEQHYVNPISSLYNQGQPSGSSESSNPDQSSDSSGGPDEPSGGADSDSGDSFAAGSQAEPRKSHATSAPAYQMNRVNQIVVKTSASAPAPASAPASQNSRQQRKGPAQVGIHLDPIDALKMKQQAADQWLQARLGQNPHLTTPAPGKALSSNRQQQPSKSTSAPYNPQNNPSHAGKYFIN